MLKNQHKELTGLRQKMIVGKLLSDAFLNINKGLETVIPIYLYYIFT